MKHLIILVSIAILMACGTTPTKQTSAKETQISTEAEINTSKYPNFFGAPQQPITVTNPHRAIQEISEPIAIKLQSASDYLEPLSDSFSPEKSLSILNSIPISELNNYEEALLYQFRGYAYIAQEKPQNAIEQFNLLLTKKDHIPVPVEAIITKTLALLYFSTEQYEQSLELMYKWPALSEHIASADYYQVSLIQEKTGDLQSAIANANKAAKMASMSSPHNFNVYAQHLANLYEKNNEPTKAENIREQIQAVNTMASQDNVIPIIKVPPVYPKDAVIQKIQGYCVVTFTVSERGDVEDAHVKPGDCKTLQGEPADLFAQSSIDAVNKFKYRPKYENGKPVKFHGMKNKISYLLEE